MTSVSDNPAIDCAAPERGRQAMSRRAKVIEAAGELFAAHGFHATGIAQIARTSGVLVGQIYRDFVNKEDIVAAVVARDLDRYLADAGLGAAIAIGDDRAVHAWFARFLRCEGAEEPRLIAEILAETARNPRMAAIFRTIEARLHGEIVRALRVIAPPDTIEARLHTLADLIFTFSSGVLQRRLSHAGGPTPEAMAAMIDCIEREIGAAQRPSAQDASGSTEGRWNR